MPKYCIAEPTTHSWYIVSGVYDSLAECIAEAHDRIKHARRFHIALTEYCVRFDGDTVTTPRGRVYPAQGQVMYAEHYVDKHGESSANIAIKSYGW